ncbi:hypothetical protein [Selenomonas ruminantium]|uniref:Uncharacterized protein n=1 Tax=Selenomonas ruminantium TaxID=971 RepID=A0A1H3VNE1_SELRU|nr:hypothetical protein [Selenomonas ruminantium]SDZ76280.1 hypothetical protein SAMN05660648_00423 [Selenomonas ruminantium]
MADMLKKLERVSNRHDKLKEKIEAMKQQLLVEEKALQKEKDKVNSKWMRTFASLAEDNGLQVYDLDPVKIIEMIAVAPKDFCVAGCSESAAEEKTSAISKDNGQGDKVSGKMAEMIKEEP